MVSPGPRPCSWRYATSREVGYRTFTLDSERRIPSASSTDVSPAICRAYQTSRPSNADPISSVASCWWVTSLPDFAETW